MSYRLQFWFRPEGGEWGVVDKTITEKSYLDLLADPKLIAKYTPSIGSIAHAYVEERPWEPKE